MHYAKLIPDKHAHFFKPAYISDYISFRGSMLKTKRDINQPYFKIVDLNFVKTK